jgi:hypothetical protein
MRATEHQHNTTEQVRAYLSFALDVVADLEIPDDLREVAFAKAVDLFSSKQIFYEQPTVIPNLRPH